MQGCNPAPFGPARVVGASPTTDKQERPESRYARAMRLVLALAAPVLLAGSAALAQAPETPTTTASPAPAAAPAHEPSPYAIALQDGMTKLSEGQALAAQLAFQRAIAADGTRAEAYYYLGLAQFRNDSHNHAIESFRTSLQVAQQHGDLFGEARARFAIAEHLEHIHGRGHHADPHAAWQELVTFAEQHPDVIHPDVPRMHLAAHERVAQLDAEYQPVRHRIAERQREAARGARH